jgi:Fe-S cluster assembly protein SufD
MTTSLESRYSRNYQDHKTYLSGQSVDWLVSLRTHALATFSTTGFPSLSEEEWRYTNVSVLEKKAFNPVGPETIVNEDLLKPYYLQEAWTVVFINGHFSPHHSQLDGLDDTITLSSIAQLLATHPEKLQPYLAQVVNQDEHNLVAFNTAWFTDGLFLTIAAEQVVDKPIQLLHFVSHPNCLATTRHIMVVEPDAQLQIVETFVGEASYLTTAVNEIFLGENSALTYCKLQAEAEESYHFGGTYIKQQPRSRFVHHNFSFGGLLARNDIHTDLDLAAECELNGLYLGCKRQHIDNHTRINHRKPQGVSREYYKGILADRARGVFQGRIIVAKDAQKTDSTMNNRNLLLSNHAEIDTKPQLEIYADDVKCAHGVTIGQLDEAAIFYLQSRGLDIKTAKNILTFAFAQECVDKVPLKSLTSLLTTQLMQLIPS